MDFKDAIQSQHGEIDGETVPDGKPHPFRSLSDRPGQNTGWYLLFLESHGCWGSPHLGGSGVWHAPSLVTSPWSDSDKE